MLEFSLDFPFAYGRPSASAVFRESPEDFVVIEDLGFDLTESGEHLYIQIRKRGENTAWVADKIAQLYGVKSHDVSYAGRKDRHAVTTQWFSVYLPKSNDLLLAQQLNSESIQVLTVKRHSQKLRRGDHASNYFEIRLRNISNEGREEISRKLSDLFSLGVPNYFGEQRFGNQGNNLVAAETLLSSRQRIRDSQKSGMILSAARSYLFNCVLAERVKQNNWQVSLSGEPEMAPSGPLWGRGRLSSSDETQLIEKQVLQAWASWCDSLEHVGLQQERRRLVLLPVNASFEWQDSDLLLRFSLSSGEFATSVLREIAELKIEEFKIVELKPAEID